MVKLTLLDGTNVEVEENDIRSFAMRVGSEPHTEVRLTGGDRIFVKETVLEILDACAASEGRA
jgi:uncharacterized protein YlzI (FlbEa/FlbD family)